MSAVGKTSCRNCLGSLMVYLGLLELEKDGQQKKTLSGIST
jgi:hypothetical protein